MGLRLVRILQFTLIELMIIVAVLSILASMMLPVISSSRAKAKLTACTGNLQTLGQSLLSYQNDNDGNNVSGWDGTVADANARTFWDKTKTYYKRDEVRECPANPEDKLECYGLYDALSGKPMAETVATPKGTVLMGENTQLAYESYSQAIQTWTRSSTGHWELGYAHTLTSDTPTTNWSARRALNPFVHRPQVNLLFCDGHVQSTHYIEAWGAPYKYGEPKNIWDDQ